MDRTTLVLTLNDGTAVDSDFLPPYSVAEQIAFEEHFRCSFTAVEYASKVLGDLARAIDGGGDSDGIDPGKAFRVTWILWFGWFRARPKVAAKFSAFLETLKDWEYFEQPDEEPASEPESPAAGTDDLSDPVGAEDGSPGPTEPTQPPSS